MTHRAFVSHGVAIGVRTNDSELLDRVPDCFPPGWEDAPVGEATAWYSIVRSESVLGNRVHYELFQDNEKLNEGFRVQPLLESMESAIRLHLGRTAPERLFVHAGAVSWRNRAIVIPGRSGAGKTTLVAALVAAGATYFSDEYAVLDENGMLYPYSRPLSFRQGEHRRLRRCAVRDLGGQLATEPLPVDFVLQTEYVPGADWAPRVLSPSEGAQTLFANTLGARERPALAFSILSHVVSGAVSLAGNRGESAATVSAIIRYIDSSFPSLRAARQ